MYVCLSICLMWTKFVAGSRFIFAWCLATVLDPLITFVIDAATLNIYYGDAFRLYRYVFVYLATVCWITSDTSPELRVMELLEYSWPSSWMHSLSWCHVSCCTCIAIRYCNHKGGSGCMLVICWLYAGYILVIFWLYCNLTTEQLHMNGRLLDVFHRLQGTEDKFVVPSDLEMSLRELNRIMDSMCRVLCSSSVIHVLWIDSRRWRGQAGGSRRVVVMHYNKPTTENPFPDPSDPPNGISIVWLHVSADSCIENGDCITHLAILNTGLSGTAELHRHFVRFPDGRFMEVLGNASTMTTKDKKLVCQHIIF